MTTPRRRIIRPDPPATNSRPHPGPKILKLRTRLDQERAALERWMKRLKRAFHTVERTQQTIRRLERQVAKLEERP